MQGRDACYWWWQRRSCCCDRDLLREAVLPPECWCWAPLDQVVVVVVVMGLKVPGGSEL